MQKFLFISLLFGNLLLFSNEGSKAVAPGNLQERAQGDGLPPNQLLDVGSVLPHPGNPLPEGLKPSQLSPLTPALENPRID